MIYFEGDIEEYKQRYARLTRIQKTDGAGLYYMKMIDEIKNKMERIHVNVYRSLDNKRRYTFTIINDFDKDKKLRIDVKFEFDLLRCKGYADEEKKKNIFDHFVKSIIIDNFYDTYGGTVKDIFVIVHYTF